MALGIHSLNIGNTMEDNKKINWSKIIKRIVMELPISQDLIENNEVYSFRYVANPNTRFGYLIIWENSSKRAIHVSRVKVLNDFPFLNIDNEEEIINNIPSDIIIEYMEP